NKNSPSGSKPKGKGQAVDWASNDKYRWSLKKTSSIPLPLYPSSSQLMPASGSETTQDLRHRPERNVVLVETDGRVRTTFVNFRIVLMAYHTYLLWLSTATDCSAISALSR
ncbi:hypothetical protein K435DRAFT_881418, partial [Dendrothele bispora CBS 962.96]